MTTSSSFSGLRVLYLEDEPLIAFDTAQHLTELGFEEVRTVYRLSNAESAAEEQRFDLAIFDINVDRGQTSVELGRKLAGEGVPVLFASGNGSDESSLCEDGHHFIGKPFSLAMLTAKLREVLAART